MELLVPQVGLFGWAGILLIAAVLLFRYFQKRSKH